MAGPWNLIQSQRRLKLEVRDAWLSGKKGGERSPCLLFEKGDKRRVTEIRPCPMYVCIIGRI
jgi:hypothetical protein